VCNLGFTYLLELFYYVMSNPATSHFVLHMILQPLKRCHPNHDGYVILVEPVYRYEFGDTPYEPSNRICVGATFRVVSPRIFGVDPSVTCYHLQRKWGLDMLTAHLRILASNGDTSMINAAIYVNRDVVYCAEQLRSTFPRAHILRNGSILVNEHC